MCDISSLPNKSTLYLPKVIAMATKVEVFHSGRIILDENDFGILFFFLGKAILTFVRARNVADTRKRHIIFDIDGLVLLVGLCIVVKRDLHDTVRILRGRIGGFMLLVKDRDTRRFFVHGFLVLTVFAYEKQHIRFAVFLALHV